MGIFRSIGFALAMALGSLISTAAFAVEHVILRPMGSLLTESANTMAKFNADLAQAMAGREELAKVDSSLQRDGNGQVRDPYNLLGEWSNDPDLDELEQVEDETKTVADGGADDFELFGRKGTGQAQGIPAYAQLSSSFVGLLSQQVQVLCFLMQRLVRAPKSTATKVLQIFRRGG